MLNIEKYKKEIITYGLYGFSVTKENKFARCVDCCCSKCVFKEDKDCSVSKRVEWLTSEYKESILDDIEREYLSAVIKPFRKRIKSIKKTAYPSNSAFISIAMDKCEHIFLPFFELNSGMYQRMEISKEYTLKELGL